MTVTKELFLNEHLSRYVASKDFPSNDSTLWLCAKIVSQNLGKNIPRHIKLSISDEFHEDFNPIFAFIFGGEEFLWDTVRPIEDGRDVYPALASWFMANFTISNDAQSPTTLYYKIEELP